MDFKQMSDMYRRVLTEEVVPFWLSHGIDPSGAINNCMKEDGTMMRTSELWELARKYHLTFITIKDLQDYLRIHEKHVKEEAVADLPTQYGEFKIHGYVNDITGEHHLALVKGEIGEGENVLCRVHSECLTGDVFGSLRCDCGCPHHRNCRLDCQFPKLKHTVFDTGRNSDI